MKATLRPSGERAGCATESGKFVSSTHCERSTGRAGLRNQTSVAASIARTTAAAIAASRQPLGVRCAS